MGSSILIIISLFLLYSHKRTDAQNIGVSYGRLGSNLPSRSDVIKLYKSKGITKMRVYSPDQDVLEALKGSTITLIVGAPEFQSLGSDPTAATKWVQTNVLPYAANINYIAVGNEVLSGDSNARFVLPAMQNLQNALLASALQPKIKVSTAIRADMINNSFPPSNSDFGSNAPYMNPIINFLKSNNSPLLINIYPYFSLIANKQQISQDYALFTSSSTVITDSGNGLQYQNLFDAIVDSFYAALEKAGGEGVDIVVSETGWPSQGTDVATPENAATYYGRLIGHVANGTPMRPGKALETYLFAMFDEDQKTGDEVERHFGLFTPDQRNKYGIRSFQG